MVGTVLSLLTFFPKIGLIWDFDKNIFFLKKLLKYDNFKNLFQNL